MISILLAILKFLGVFILVLLGIILTVLLLVLFVPVRYKFTAHRKIMEDSPIVAEVKITWLLHILNVAFSYPKAAYVRVRLFCFTVFKTGQLIGKNSEDGEAEKAEKLKDKKTKKNELKKTKQKAETAEEKVESRKEDTKKEGTSEENTSAASVKQAQNTEDEKQPGINESPGDEPQDEQAESLKEKVILFFRKLLELLQNIRYTIMGIYDKIKHIVNNIQYYINIIKSETFGRAWTVCSGQVFSLLKSIGPRKVEGTLLIGTGDPASTGQVMAAYGILYPFIGEHINITPDFEQQIVEGDLLIKGKITIFKAIKTAWIIYFNKDLRRLIKLFKREAA